MNLECQKLYFHLIFWQPFKVFNFLFKKCWKKKETENAKVKIKLCTLIAENVWRQKDDWKKLLINKIVNIMKFFVCFRDKTKSDNEISSLWKKLVTQILKKKNTKIFPQGIFFQFSKWLSNIFPIVNFRCFVGKNKTYFQMVIFWGKL